MCLPSTPTLYPTHRKLIGPDKELYLNLMVATINRSKHRPDTMRRLFAYDPFHCVEDGTRLTEDTEENIASKLNRYAEMYFGRLDHEFREEDKKRTHPWTDGYLHIKFAIRKGKYAPDKGTIYYMGFASVKLSFMHIAKQAMMKVTDVPDDLLFSAFYRQDSEKIPEYERKTDDEYEAKIIWEKLGFQGETKSLGEVRKKILLETPFVYHSRALKILEDSLRIVHVQPEEGASRQMGSFCAGHTPCSIHEFDFNKKRIHGNHWRVTFCTEDVYRETLQFFSSPKENKRAFMPWLKMKLEAMGGADRLIEDPNSGVFPVFMKELQRTIPKDGERPKPSCTRLYEVLKEMIKEGTVEEHEPEKHKLVGSKIFYLI